MTVRSVSERRLSGAPGVARSATRSRWITVRRPPGVVSVIRDAIGDCMPKRGSGPTSSTIFVPSGRVVVLVPSAPASVTVLRPSPSVIVRLIVSSPVRSVR